MDFIEAKVFWHKLRAGVLNAIRRGPARATDLSRKLKRPPSEILYHLTVLERTGFARIADGQDPNEPDPIFEAGPR